MPPDSQAAWVHARRDDHLCGAAMIVAPLLILAAMVIHSPHGVDASSWLESLEAGHTRFYLAHLLFLAAAAALVPASLGLADLVMDTEPRLARLGRLLALLGVAGLCALVGMDLFLWQLVADPAIEPDQALSAAERVTASAAINVPIALLVGGLPAGLALLALGLHRAQVVKPWEAGAIALAVPLTFGGLPVGWLAVAGALIATAGMGSVGWTLLRRSTPTNRATSSAVARHHPLEGSAT